MRPIKLTMSAFGPYAGVQEIQFGELGDNGLYLITGDTGAGKTTIFDAICYALYGAPSGENRNSKMLRSTYAKADAETFVELIFVHRDHQYTIKRWPEQERAKKRGEGTTKSSTCVEFTCPDGIFSDKKVVDKQIRQLLGVDRSQFAQISMLAQGDFLKLLLASTDDRVAIFRELFHTEKYEELANEVKKKVTELKQEWNDKEKSIAQYKSGIICDEDDVLAMQVDKAKKGEITTAEVISLIDSLIESDSACHDAKEAENQDTDRRLKELDNAIGKAEELEKSKKKLSIVKAELDEASESKKTAETELNEARTALLAADELNKQVNFIETELPIYDKVNNLKNQIEKTKKSLDQNVKILEKNNNDVTAKQDDINRLKKEQESLASAGEKRIGLEMEKKNLTEYVSDISGLQKKITELHKMEEQVCEAREIYGRLSAEYDKKRTEYDEMEKAYRDEQAGILASRLEPGDACPVCGSISHPKLAVISELHKGLTREKIDKAKSASEAAHKAAMDSSTDVKIKNEEVKSVRTNITDQAEKLYADIRVIYDEDNDVIESNVVDIDELSQKLMEDKKNKKARLFDIEEEIALEIKNVDRKNKLSELIPHTEEDLEDARKMVSDLDRKIAALKTELENKKSQFEELSSGLKYKSRDEAEAQIRTLVSKVKKLKDDFDRAEKKHTDIDKKISDYGGQVKAISETLKNSPEYDLTKLRADREETHNRQDQLRKIIKEIDYRISTNKEQRNNIAEKSNELSKLEDKRTWMEPLSNTLSGAVGNGQNKIRFETHVQMTYFDRMVQRANKRFLTMSDGQYELKRVEESSNNRSQTGLDLCVIDHYNGSERDVKTLSGGESFMASLSLALGLSDEVQASAGGIQIDTMFVDEGFGSLDTEKTLPQAYNALVSVTEGNKLVGIISHVSELKEKIDKQIVVTKDRDGKAKAVLKTE